MKTVLRDIAARADQIAELDQVESVAEKLFLGQMEKLDLTQPLNERTGAGINMVLNNALFIADTYVKTIRQCRAKEMMRLGIMPEEMTMSFEP